MIKKFFVLFLAFFIFYSIINLSNIISWTKDLAQQQLLTPLIALCALFTTVISVYIAYTAYKSGQWNSVLTVEQGFVQNKLGIQPIRKNINILNLFHDSHFLASIFVEGLSPKEIAQDFSEVIADADNFDVEPKLEYIKVTVRNVGRGILRFPRPVLSVRNKKRAIAPLIVFKNGTVIELNSDEYVKLENGETVQFLYPYYRVAWLANDFNSLKTFGFFKRLNNSKKPQSKIKRCFNAIVLFTYKFKIRGLPISFEIVENNGSYKKLDKRHILHIPIANFVLFSNSNDMKTYKFLLLQKPDLELLEKAKNNILRQLIRHEIFQVVHEFIVTRSNFVENYSDYEKQFMATSQQLTEYFLDKIDINSARLEQSNRLFYNLTTLRFKYEDYKNYLDSKKHFPYPPFSIKGIELQETEMITLFHNLKLEIVRLSENYELSVWKRLY